MTLSTADAKPQGTPSQAKGIQLSVVIPTFKERGNVAELVKKGTMSHGERMTEMYAACIASMGDSLWDGAAAVMASPLGVVCGTEMGPGGAKAIPAAKISGYLGLR